MTLTYTLAGRVASRMRRDGFECTTDDIWMVWKTGDLEDRESLCSRILQEFEEIGIEVPR